MKASECFFSDESISLVVFNKYVQPLTPEDNIEFRKWERTWKKDNKNGSVRW